MEKNNVELFFCYSVELRNYLYQQHIKYRVAAINPNSQKMFWMYIKDDALDKALNNYRIKKPINE